jgi:hypothetical protein
MIDTNIWQRLLSLTLVLLAGAAFRHPSTLGDNPAVHHRLLVFWHFNNVVL